MAFLLNKKVKIPDKYSNFVDIFSKKKVLVLSERTKLNKHDINLGNSTQTLYRLIYSLGLVELETFKIYIKTHLKTNFIQPFKSLADALILFTKEPDGSFCLYIDYLDLNNLIIKNRYPFPLIEKLLEQLG